MRAGDALRLVVGDGTLGVFRDASQEIYYLSAGDRPLAVGSKALMLQRYEQLRTPTGDDTMNAPAGPQKGTIEWYTQKYIQLRDKIAEVKKRQADELAPLAEALEKLNGILLDHLNTVGVDSARSSAGTVYKTTKNSASIADGDAFRRYVIGSEAWELLDWKANAARVQEFIAENEAPPPGINFTQTFVVGVRRA